VLVFAIIGFIALQILVAKLQGSKAAFTLFDLFSPTAGGFLGAGFGVLAVAIMNGANFILHGIHNADTGAIIRLFPMLFAALYFGRKSIFNIIIPAAARKRTGTFGNVKFHRSFRIFTGFNGIVG